MDCRLVHVSSGREEMFTLKEGVTTIGRDVDNDIQLTESGTSRHHAQILNLPSVCQLQDLKSANGTTVNGQRVTSRALSDGCEIRFGREIFRYEEVASVGSGDEVGGRKTYSTRARNVTAKMTAPPPVKPSPVISQLPPLKRKA